MTKIILATVPTGLINLKIKPVDVAKLKAVLIDSEKISYVVHKEFVKNTKFNLLNTQVNKSKENF